MRKSLLSFAAAVAVLSTGALSSAPAAAMTPMTIPGIQAALEAANLLEDVRYVCRHRWNTSGRRCYWRPATRVCRHDWRTSRRWCRWR